MLNERHRAPARHRGRLHLARARVLGGRPAAAGDRHAREGADERRARTATSASGSGSISPRATPTARARSRCSRACPPDDVEALNGLGIAYGDAGRYADAIATFRQVLALDPTNGLAYQNLASMVLAPGAGGEERPERRAKLQEAEAFARQAIEVDPALPDAYTTLGVVLSTSGRKTRRDRQLEARRRSSTRRSSTRSTT